LERRQSFIRSHNEPLSVATMCVGSEDRSPEHVSEAIQCRTSDRTLWV
jgi:hypothetical protein